MAAVIRKVVDHRGNKMGYRVEKKGGEIISQRNIHGPDFVAAQAVPGKTSSFDAPGAQNPGVGAALGVIAYQNLKKARDGRPYYDCPYCGAYYQDPFRTETDEGLQRVISCKRCGEMYRP